MYKTLLLILIATMASHATAAEADKNNKKLKVVLLFGQSNMVGMCEARTAWYLTQPMYVPPRESFTTPTRYFDWSVPFWDGIRYARGSKEFDEKTAALLKERSDSRGEWRRRVYGKDWKPEYGPMPVTGQKTMIPFLHKKAEEEGIYKRIKEHIESPENTFPPSAAYEEVKNRDKEIAEDINRVRKLFLNGAKGEDFDTLDKALASAKKQKVTDRKIYAVLAKKYANLPIAQRTYVAGYGMIAGEKTEYPGTSETQGKLSIGYGRGATGIGPEYGFGIAFENLVDGPVLIIKCSWGGTSLMADWRPPSLNGAETPIEKAEREAANKVAEERAKASGKDFTPKPPMTNAGSQYKCWEWSMAYVKKVLADPAKYHPHYDSKAGYEVAGMVWFQGWNDQGNKAYGEQLVHFVKDVRKEVNAPNMPAVCGLLGGATFKNSTFDGNVNGGMLYAAKSTELAGTVDVVNTVKYFPYELGLLNTARDAYEKGSPEYETLDAILKRAVSNRGFHYHGSAKFFILTGDAMARQLANLMDGGEPVIYKEAEALEYSK